MGWMLPELKEVPGRPKEPRRKKKRGTYRWRNVGRKEQEKNGKSKRMKSERGKERKEKDGV